MGGGVKGKSYSMGGGGKTKVPSKTPTYFISGIALTSLQLAYPVGNSKDIILQSCTFI